MVYNFADFKMRTPSIKTSEMSLNWHFAYQLPLAIMALYTTAGMDISKFIIPAVGIWAIAWANHYN